MGKSTIAVNLALALAKEGALTGPEDAQMSSTLKPRIYPATDDGSLTGKPVFLSQARWGAAQKRPALDRQRVALAQSDRPDSPSATKFDA